MASAEHLLHEAQYAFQSISFGESRENTRNASRAKSLCNKIIRKFPATIEAGEAHAILRRLGAEAYIAKLQSQHRHVPQSTHHRAPLPAPQSQSKFVSDSGLESLNWTGLVTRLFMLPKTVLAMIAFAGIFLFGIVGPFLFLPLIAFVLLTGPFRKILKPEQRENLNAFVVQANAFIESERG